MIFIFALIESEFFYLNILRGVNMKKVLIVLMILCSVSLAFSVASYDALRSNSWAIPSINSPYYSYPYYAPPTVPITSALPSRPVAVASMVPYAYTPYPAPVYAAQMAPVYPATYAAPAVYGSPYVISQTTTYYSRGYVTAPVPVYPYSAYPYTPYYCGYSYPYVYPTRVIY